jgi:hypothetical protein
MVAVYDNSHFSHALNRAGKVYTGAVQVLDSCEHSNKPFDSIKCGEFFE